MPMRPLSQRETKELNREEFWREDPLLQTLSTHKDSNPRRNSASAQDSKKSAENKRSRTFRTVASVDLPLRVQENRGLVPEQNVPVRTSLRFVLPPTANGGKWSAALGGSSVVRGPIGCATGNANLAFHFSHVQVFGGMHVGDQARFSIGGSATSKDKLKLISIQLTSVPKGSLTSGLTARYTKNKLWSANANISISSALRTTMGVSISTLTPHKVHFGMRWVSLRPSLWPAIQLKFQPRLSDKLRLSMSCANQWQVGGDLTQFFRSNTTALTIGVSHFKRRLLWTFTWHHGDVMIRVPILITATTGTLLNFVYTSLLSILSGTIQATLARILRTHDATLDISLRDELTLMHRNKQQADAEQQRILMSRQANNRVMAEEQNKGLIVRHAVYAVQGGDTWDVTTQLQFWTNNSSLELPASSKQHLLGFYDVTASVDGAASSTNKKGKEVLSWLGNLWQSNCTEIPRPEPTLSVQYEYSGELYEIVISDFDSLSLPSSKAIPLR